MGRPARICPFSGSVERFLIVTEGSSDAHIVEHAFKLLKPHIADFFDFVDMEEGYPFSGTGNLFRFLQGLISISIQNNVVVIFDNDAEGVANYKRSCALKVPANMLILKLPDNPYFAEFDTIGPTVGTRPISTAALRQSNATSISVRCRSSARRASITGQIPTRRIDQQSRLCPELP